MEVSRARFDMIIRLSLQTLANMVQILFDLWAEIMQLAVKMFFSYIDCLLYSNNQTFQ